MYVGLPLRSCELRDDVVEAVAYQAPDEPPIFHRVGSYCARNADPRQARFGREFLRKPSSRSSRDASNSVSIAQSGSVGLATDA